MRIRDPKKAITFASKELNKSPNSNESALLPIIAKANILIELNKKVTSCLPANLRYVSQVANVDRNQLTILTASGTYATELRYQTQDLIRKFKSDPALSRFTNIQIIVRPKEGKREPIPRKPPALSHESADLIESIANACEDPMLRKALLNLSKNTITPQLKRDEHKK